MADPVDTATLRAAVEAYENAPYGDDMYAKDVRLAASATWMLVAAADEIDGLRQSLDEAIGPHCSSCGNAIDPAVCWCGDGPAAQHCDETHPFIPMGCDCSRAERDWQKVATARGERLWQTQRELEALTARVAAMTEASRG